MTAHANPEPIKIRTRLCYEIRSGANCYWMEIDPRHCPSDRGDGYTCHRVDPGVRAAAAQGIDVFGPWRARMVAAA